MSEPVKPRLSATVMIVRDTPGGIEVFMVVRHRQIEFAAGAIVFPGGSLDQTDRDPRIRALADGVDDVDDDALALRVAAAREAFEECGVLYARRPGGEIIEGSLAHQLGAAYRARLEADEIGMADVAEAEGLRLALDRLTPFAHWITPEPLPKRFDTHFFLAQAPGDHALLHDGNEAVDSVWISPSEALAQAAADKLTMIFATRLNLERLDKSSTVAEAVERARADTIVTVMPKMRKTETGRILTIPIQAGYGASEYVVNTSAIADKKRD